MLSISDKALEKIIHNYTREAGVRNLERRIGEICRKAAREFLEKKRKSVHITEGNLQKYLGKEKITFENANEEDEVGIVRGLAWTSVDRPDGRCHEGIRADRTDVCKICG